MQIFNHLLAFRTKYFDIPHPYSVEKRQFSSLCLLRFAKASIMIFRRYVASPDDEYAFSHF